jgi:enterochelin esterase-like enzyme
MKRLFCAILVGAMITLVAGPFQAQAQKKSWPKPEWVDPNRTAPNGTTYKTFASKVLGEEVSYLVYLPPEYNQQTQRYPVIYWLHGLGGNQRAGSVVFVPHLDKAIRTGSLPPAIVVVVNGMVTSFYCDWANGKRPIESVITKDLVPHIDLTYRTIARRQGRFIQGYSMGGYGAAHLGFKYPEVFGTVVVDAGALVGVQALKSPRMGPLFKDIFGDNPGRFLAEHPNELVVKNAEQIRNQMNIRIGVGEDDGLLPANQGLHEVLQRLNVAHQYEVVPGVAHSGIEYYKKLGTKGFDFHRKVFESLASTK